MANSPADIRRWNLNPSAPAAAPAAPAAQAYGTQTNMAPSGSGILPAASSMPSPPGLLESVMFSGIPGYTQNRYKDRLARWKQQSDAMVARQANARLAGVMNPAGQDLMMQPQQGGLMGPAQQQWAASQNPAQMQATRHQYRADAYEKLGMPIAAQEERQQAGALYQSGYEFERKEARADLTEARQQQAHQLKMEMDIMGDPVKERQAPQLAALYVTKAQELVESAGGVNNMTGADDEALITFYVKALRPLESVMGEEAARAMEMSASAEFRKWVESLKKDNKLDGPARQKILDTLGSVGENAWKEYQRLSGDMRSRGERFGVPMGSQIREPKGRIRWDL